MLRPPPPPQSGRPDTHLLYLPLLRRFLHFHLQILNQLRLLTQRALHLVAVLTEVSLATRLQLHPLALLNTTPVFQLGLFLRVLRPARTVLRPARIQLFFVFLTKCTCCFCVLCKNACIDRPQNCAQTSFRSCAGLRPNFGHLRSKLYPIMCRSRTKLCPISFAPCPFPNLAGTLYSRSHHSKRHTLSLTTSLYSSLTLHHSQRHTQRPGRRVPNTSNQGACSKSKCRI